VRIYTLTPLTRRARSQRRAVLAGFDLPWQALKVFGLGALPALLVTLLTWPVLGAWALVAFVAVEAATWWFVESRDTTGLRVKRWRGVLDRHRARLGVLFVCGEPLIPHRGRRVKLVASTARVTRPEPSLDDLFGLPGRPKT
jgi:hypothetical protein